MTSVVNWSFLCAMNLHKHSLNPNWPPFRPLKVVDVRGIVKQCSPEPKKLTIKKVNKSRCCSKQSAKYFPLLSIQSSSMYKYNHSFLPSFNISSISFPASPYLLSLGLLLLPGCQLHLQVLVESINSPAIKVTFFLHACYGPDAWLLSVLYHFKHGLELKFLI